MGRANCEGDVECVHFTATLKYCVIISTSHYYEIRYNQTIRVYLNENVMETSKKNEDVIFATGFIQFCI